jgi:hypothetical protein
MNQYQLEYRLLAAYPDYFWCDPDYYPIAREGQEQQNAIDQFSAIQANQQEFQAILDYLSLGAKSSYTDEEKLLIYRQHKRLTRIIQMTAGASGSFTFSLRTGEGQGLKIDGTVSATGAIKVTSSTTSFNTCPICLAAGTLIGTPDGPLAVESVKVGTMVWTLDASGNRVAVPVIETHSTAVPAGFQMVKVTLSDGRVVTASPGHPTSDMRALGDYVAGDTLDSAVVISAERVPNETGATYDILPAGGTGPYWADGVLLLSTLAGK